MGNEVPEGRTILDSTEAEEMGWQWHQLDHMQVVCTWLQRDNHASISSLSFLQAGVDALPTAQLTALKHISSISKSCKFSRLL